MKSNKCELYGDCNIFPLRSMMVKKEREIVTVHYFLVHNDNETIAANVEILDIGQFNQV